MRSDPNVKQSQRDEGDLGDFGATTPKDAFSGGERDNLFVNHHGEQFYDCAGVAGLDDGGDGRSSAFFDYNRDGYQDILVMSATEPTLQFYRNRLPEIIAPQGSAGVIALRLVGGNKAAAPASGWSPREGYGARVSIQVGHNAITREHRCGDGRAVQNSATMLVGLDREPAAEKLSIRWPSGKTTELASVAAGKLVTAYENAEDSPDGQAFVVLDYLLDIPQAAKPASSGKDFSEVLGLSDAVPTAKLNLIVAMYVDCKSCKTKMPALQMVRNAFPTSELGIYGISTHIEEKPGDDADTPQELALYESEHKPAYDVVADASPELRKKVLEHLRSLYYGDAPTPSTIILDATGKMLKTIQGVPTVSELRKMIPH